MLLLVRRCFKSPGCSSIAALSELVLFVKFSTRRGRLCVPSLTLFFFFLFLQEDCCTKADLRTLSPMSEESCISL